MALQTPSQALEQSRDLIRALAVQHRTANPRVFGSVLTGKDREGSDLDVLVEPLPQTTLFDLGGLQDALEEALGVRVDVRTPMDLPPIFGRTCCAGRSRFERTGAAGRIPPANGPGCDGCADLHRRHGRSRFLGRSENTARRGHEPDDRGRGCQPGRHRSSRIFRSQFRHPVARHAGDAQSHRAWIPRHRPACGLANGSGRAATSD